MKYFASNLLLAARIDEEKFGSFNDGEEENLSSPPGHNMQRHWTAVPEFCSLHLFIIILSSILFSEMKIPEGEEEEEVVTLIAFCYGPDTVRICV